MYVKELIELLSKQDQDALIPFAFGGLGHSDRGYYEDLAFSEVENVTFRFVLKSVKDMVGQTITGYKGGDYKVTDYTKVKIGEDSSRCGDDVSPLLVRYMAASAKAPRKHAKAGKGK